MYDFVVGFNVVVYLVLFNVDVLMTMIRLTIELFFSGHKSFGEVWRMP